MSWPKWKESLEASALWRFLSWLEPHQCSVSCFGWRKRYKACYYYFIWGVLWGIIWSLNWSVRLNQCVILGQEGGICMIWLLATTRSILILTSQSLHMKMMDVVHWGRVKEIIVVKVVVRNTYRILLRYLFVSSYFNEIKLLRSWLSTVWLISDISCLYISVCCCV